MNVAGRYVGGKELRRWSEIVCPSIRAGLPKQVNRSGHGVSVVLHPAVDRAGKEAAKCTLEFFTARIPNPNTREATGARCGGSANGAMRSV